MKTLPPTVIKAYRRIRMTVIGLTIVSFLCAVVLVVHSQDPSTPPTLRGESSTVILVPNRTVNAGEVRFKPDSDHDGMSDEAEVSNGTNPNDPSTADPGQPSTKFTRFTSNVAALGSGPSGGQIIVLEAWDDPALVLAIRHPTTHNPWTQIRGGNGFRETLIAYTVGFDKNFVAIGTGEWRITFDGNNNPDGWQSQGAGVFLQGGTGNSKPLTFFTQQPADTFGLRVFGPSFKYSLQQLGNYGVVYSP